jgi:two-component system LytT family response regulator
MNRNEWKVLIVDDEPAARRGVRQLLIGFPEFRVVGECRNGAEALAALDALAPDVIFLDVQMPGMDGFEVIRQRTVERMPAVVFLTAFDQYAIRAFEAEAVDYLVKPLVEERFAATMRRLARRLPERERSNGNDVLLVRTPRGALTVNVRDVEWIEAAGNYAQLWVGPRNFLIRESLGKLEERFGKEGFIRAHRRALVRVEWVRELVRDASGEFVAVLAGGARIPVSRRRVAAFVRAIRTQVSL